MRTAARSVARSAAVAAVAIPLLALALGARPATAQDPAQLARACDTGDAAACSTLGFLHEVGGGVPQDLERAAALYERACGGGIAAGCHSLALMYEAGSGVNRDIDRAVELYGTACEGGGSQACDRLAAMGQTDAAAPSALQFPRSGRITDAATGAPLAEAIVDVPGLGVRAVSDAEGRVSLGRIVAGRHRIRVERFGYETAEGDLIVPAETDFVLLLTPAAIDDPFAPGRITGRVLDEGGADGLANVEIVAADSPSALATLSGARGGFTLTGVPPGLVELRFSLIGYATRTATVVVQPGQTVELTATMSTEAIELEPIEVVVRNSYLVRRGFYRREAAGWGDHFSPEDLDRLDPMYLSDLVRRVPGVALRATAEGTIAVSRGGRRSLGGDREYCALSIWVDGAPTFDADLDRYTPQQIAAVEIYNGGPGTPIEYTFQSPCGVILLWSR